MLLTFILDKIMFCFVFLFSCKKVFCAFGAMKTTPKQINVVQGALYVRKRTAPETKKKYKRRQIDSKNAVAATDLSHFNDDTIVCIKLQSGLVWGESSR